MINQLRQGTQSGNHFFPCPAAVTAGMPVLIGTIAAIAMNAYDATLGGTTFCLDGDFSLTVIGQSTQSPVSGLAIATGEELYASGTLDGPTNVTYNLTIDKTRGNCPFGNYVGTAGIAAGVTDTAAPVRLKTGGSPGPYAP